MFSRSARGSCSSSAAWGFRCGVSGVQVQVQVQHLVATEHMVPHGGATEVHVEIYEAVGRGHDDELLHFRVEHVLQVVGGLGLQLLEVPGPGLVDPVHLANDPRRRHLQGKYKYPGKTNTK